jgi:hypothetical protein
VRCSDEGGGILAGGPDLRLEEVEERFGLGGGFEVDVDDDIPRIVDWPRDAVLEHAGLLTVFAEALEGRVPEVEVLDGVLNVKCWHGGSFGGSCCWFPRR